MRVANELAVQQVSQTGDADLGLKAARFASAGTVGVVHFAMETAATLRDAIDVGARFARLSSDALRLEVDVEGRRATVRMRSSVQAPRAIADFAVATMYSNRFERLGDDARVECWFDHPRPGRTTEYERSFERATLRFGAQGYGFALDRDCLYQPLSTSDPALHIVLCAHASILLAQLSERVSMIDRVRGLAMKELLHGNPTVGSAARAMRMSTRTLASRLQREGTTFRALIDQIRCELALGYLTDRRLTPAEVAFRLGFSHVEAFYRAFRRWTGQTPASYRRAHGLGAVRALSPGALEEAPGDRENGGV